MLTLFTPVREGSNINKFTGNLPRAVYTIKENHYVDDHLDSVETKEEAIKLAVDVRLIHKQAGFEMQNWTSNSSKVMNALGKTDNVLTQRLDMGAEHPRSEKYSKY